MKRKYYRHGLELIRRMFSINSQPGRGSAEYDPAAAILITQTVPPARRSLRRRDGTCLWGIESRHRQ